ncbi:hypothetical protein GH714_027651 [Hevea brasiliensis]|uniref:Splicing factor 3B subunit 1 domain-containing protein n=1 Tax=Hevea brasiliensis TaxID=3981 RepID=A0A6A6N7L8_HEVBR|nr:hypothetical protein GH714_027651 [Hevea brasiliensis]
MDPEIAKTQEERKKMEKELASLTTLTFDKDLYGGTDRDAYVTSIPVNDEDDFEVGDNEVARKLASYTAPKSLLKEMPRGGDEMDDGGFKKPSKIIDREDDYRRRRLNRVISPDRHDAFAAGEKTPDPSEAAPKRRNRWDQSQDDGAAAKKAKTGSDWDLPDATPGIGRWDATPTPGRLGDATPSVGRRNRWDETPTPGRLADSDATPAGGVTPGATPAGVTWDDSQRFGHPNPKKAEVTLG